MPKHHNEPTVDLAKSLRVDAVELYLGKRAGRGLVGVLLGLVVLGAVFGLTTGCQSLRNASQASIEHADVLMPPVSQQSGEFVSATGCSSGFTLFRSQGDRRAVRVVLAHGFLRSRHHMQGLAVALAHRGLATTTLDLCNMRPWRAAVQENADDMVQLARQLEAERVVYAGFSAGALAALVAARADSGSMGVFALDLVDYAGIGRRTAEMLDAPLVGLLGEPSSCNRFNQAIAVYESSDDAVYRLVDGASHCDFESSTDALCRTFCESVTRTDREQRQTKAVIRQSALAAIEAMAAGRSSWPVESAER